MCGISGFLLSEKERRPRDHSLAIVSSMCKAIVHRGPDDSGRYFDSASSLTLGHQRLAIIDIDGGRQPMSVGDLHLVYNGEIYNFRDIRSTLKDKGHQFVSHSDTEVILAAYREWGEDCVQYFRGMFAFALWDGVKRKLFCARDRLGIKPFYYFWDGRNFVFCSEIKGLLQHPVVTKELEPSAIINYLRLNYVSAPSTILKNVFKLPSAHILSVETGCLRVEKFWDPFSMKQEPPGSFEEACHQTRTLLQQSVHLNLESDVPVGALLSGGLDSSAVVALMSQYTDETNTFCIGFDERCFDERHYAKEVAKKFSTVHTDRVAHAGLLDDIKTIIWHLDEPFADASAIPMYHLSKLAREKVKVCLSGDGGDENFAGYDWHSEVLKMGPLGRLPLAALKWLSGGLFSRGLNYTYRGTTFLHNIGKRIEDQHYRLVSNFSDEHIKRLLSQEFYVDEQWPENPLLIPYRETRFVDDQIPKVLYADLNTYLVDDVLAKVDRMSMAHSLEVRVPLLDHKLVEAAFSMPASYKIDKYTRKKVLKHALSDLFSPDFMSRGKMGFSPPLRKWLLNDLREVVEHYLLSPMGIRSGVFDKAEVSQLWRVFEKGKYRIDTSKLIWALLCFEMWYEQYMLGDSPVFAGQ